MPLGFDNNLTINAIVDTRAYVSAIAQNKLDRVKQVAPNNIFKIDDPPNFQLQVASGHLEKSSATHTPIFDIGDNNLLNILS